MNNKVTGNQPTVCKEPAGRLVREATNALVQRQSQLATGIDLTLSIKHAHWNVKCAGFIGLHDVLDGLCVELNGSVDQIAERIVQLGSQAYGMSRSALEATYLPPNAAAISSIPNHLRELIKRYSTYASATDKAIVPLDDACDDGRTDLLDGFSRALDKQIWFLKSNLPLEHRER